MLRSIRRPAPTALTLCLLALAGSAFGAMQPPATEPRPAQPAAVEPATAAAPATLKPAPETDAIYAGLMGALSPEELTYLRHLVTLANPWMEGREPGDRGNELAAEYVEWAFRQIGLRPAFPITEKAADGTEVRTPSSSYRQPFPFTPRLNATRQSVRALEATGPFGQAAGGALMVPGVDFSVLGMSGSGRVDGSVVFVGYSIENGPDGYSSYAGPAGADDLKGRIAMVLRFEPLDERGRSRWRRPAEGATGPAGFSPASALAGKIKAAVDRGAAAVVVVNPPGVDDPRAQVLDTIRAGSTRGFSASGGPAGSNGEPQGVPVVQLSTRAADELVRRSGTTLAQLRAEADGKQPGAVGVRVLQGSRLSIDVAVERRPVIAENVAAVLPGRGGLASQYIVIGAHYDHVGFGYFGSRARNPQGVLHPGADDNASGTAGLLLAAERLSRAYAALPAGAEARSIVFIAFTAEESGLNGARHFVRNSPVPAGAITAMLNLDMIGRVRDNKVTAAGTGTAEGFADLLAPVFNGSEMNVRTLPGGRGPSDHAEFYGANIPVLHFFSGLHADYHMPGDTSEKINTPGAVRTVGVVTDTTLLLARRPEGLTFTKSTGRSVDMTILPDAPTPPPRLIAPGQTQPAPAPEPAPKPVSATTPAAPPAGAHGAGAEGGDNPQPVTGTRVRFGIAPGDYGDDQPGVLVGDVYPDTSAAAAGIRKGDRLMQWNGQAIKDIEAWMPLLQAARPGQEVRITLLREGKTLEVPVKLRARD